MNEIHTTEKRQFLKDIKKVADSLEKISKTLEEQKELVITKNDGALIASITKENAIISEGYNIEVTRDY
ncbi:MAG: hypothetical protein ACOX3H_06705 [Saccharofermentanales bacterium]|jgi:phosphohistidine swiveling domain-containing protein